MAAGNPAWLGLLPPPNTSVLNTMGNVFRFVFRIVRGIFPRCFRLNKISKLKAVTEKQALLNSSASDAEAAVPLLRQEQVAAISPAVSTVSTATQAEHGKLEDSAVPQTIPVEVYMALKQRLELLQMENALLTEEMNRRLELLQAENTLLTEEMQLVQVVTTLTEPPPCPPFPPQMKTRSLFL